MQKWRNWLPCLGTFLVQMTVFGIHNNFGLIYHHLIDEFNSSEAETAWIGSFAMGVTFLLSPLANLVMTTIGFSYTMVLSTILGITSLVSSSFVNNIHLLSFTYSIMWGCGSALANHASFVIIQENYRGKLSLANGIASSGTGIGTLAVGPYLGYILHKYHFRWAFRICAVTPLCFLLTIVFAKLNKVKDSDPDRGATTVVSDTNSGVTFSVADNIGYECGGEKVIVPNQEEHMVNSSIVQPQNSDDTKINEMSPNENENVDNGNSTKELLKSMFNKELWTNKSYAMFIVGVSIFLFGYFIPFVFLVQKATQLGIPAQRAQFLISILSIISTATKILCGYMLDSQRRFRISTIVLIAMYSMSLSHLIPGLATEYWHFVIFSALFGICEGCFVGQLCAVVTDTVPKIELVGTAISNLYAFMSLSLMIGPVVAGKLASILNSLNVSFFVATGISLTGTVIATLLKIFETEKVPVDSDEVREESPHRDV